MNSAPAISVCIPAYNGDRFIGATIQSVLNQTFKDFELIVSDDLSSDHTIEVVTLFPDPRIRLLRNDRNLGLGGNWNRVLSSALGKYVKLLCEDDLLHPDCLERQVRVLENPIFGSVVLTVCARNIINENGRVVLRGRRSRFRGVVEGKRLIRGSIRGGTNFIGEPVVGLFRREALGKTAPCDTSNPFMSDLDLWAKLLKTGDAYVDPDCLASFRISRQAASSVIGLRQAASFRTFARKQYTQAAYGVSRFDVFSGSVRSFGWCLVRNAVVRAFSGRARDDEALPISPMAIANSATNPGSRTQAVQGTATANRTCSSCT
ncbi:MAG TPA: glycosyltransferase [Verrucomicrobiae bacterium]|nr:glycosyltransferase [Verrucomicrobiae bacterium]